MLGSSWKKKEGSTNQVTEANGVWREENKLTYGPFGPRWCILQLDRAGIGQGGRDKGPWSSLLVESYSQHHAARRASISRTSPRSLHSFLIWKTQLHCTQIRWMKIFLEITNQRKEFNNIVHVVGPHGLNKACPRSNQMILSKQNSGWATVVLNRTSFL